MEDLSGRVAVVTGAASGIGGAVAAAFADAGTRVVLADVDTEGLTAACDELAGLGHDVVGVPTDVSSEEDIERLAARTIERFGRVDVVHNNAGVVSSGLVEEISLQSWRWVLTVDLWSVIHGARTFVPILKQQGSGHIVNTASTAGLQASPGIGPYNVAKFGVVGLSETLRLECEPHGVGVSVLCPGAVDTRIVDAERNRPATVPPSTGPTAEQFTQRSGELLRTEGLPPTAVAAAVVDAVRTNRFWVLTHPGWYDVLDARTAGIRTGNLVRGFGG
jgi:NAD(P)-dependent dehydrogenase (short-subunit alcohol dehydrogenase family)